MDDLDYRRGATFLQIFVRFSFSGEKGRGSVSRRLVLVVFSRDWFQIDSLRNLLKNVIKINIKEKAHVLKIRGYS